MTTYDGRNRKEYEANEFASELLMPEEIFKEKIKYEDIPCDYSFQQESKRESNTLDRSERVGGFLSYIC